MSDTTDPPPVDFLSDGTIRLRLSKTYRLRRPRLKEYRTLRERFYTVNDDVARIAEEHRAEGRRIDDETRLLVEETNDAGEVVARPESDLSDDEKALLRDLKRSSRDLIDDMLDAHADVRVAFFREIVEMLSTDGALLEDDVEAWMAGSGLLVDLFSHWMAVPLGRGPSGKR